MSCVCFVANSQRSGFFSKHHLLCLNIKKKSWPPDFIERKNRKRLLVVDFNHFQFSVHCGTICSNVYKLSCPM